MPKSKKPKSSDISDRTESFSTSKPLSPSRKASLLRLEAKLERIQPVEFQKDKAGKGVTLKAPDPFDTNIQVFETTGIPEIGTGVRLIEQAFNAQPQSNAKWYTVSRLMHEIAPQDGLEGMLATQMVTAHNLSMEYARRAMGKEISSDQAERYINRTAKLMNLFTRQMEALQKYRTKGQQKITVQHVQVAEGGQAIIGNVHQGGVNEG